MTTYPYPWYYDFEWLAATVWSGHVWVAWAPHTEEYKMDQGVDCLSVPTCLRFQRDIIAWTPVAPKPTPSYPALPEDPA